MSCPRCKSQNFVLERSTELKCDFAHCISCGYYIDEQIYLNKTIGPEKVKWMRKIPNTKRLPDDSDFLAVHDGNNSLHRIIRGY